MLVQNLGRQTKSIMVCYDTFWSGQFYYRRISLEQKNHHRDVFSNNRLRIFETIT